MHESLDYQQVWVWSVFEGPFNHFSDECEDVDCDAPDFSMVVCKCTYGFNDKVVDHEIVFGSFNTAYAFKKYVNESLGPVCVDSWADANLDEYGNLK